MLMTSWASAQQEALNHYLQMAAEHNPGVKAKFNDYLAAMEAVPQVKALPDPQIAFAYFISPVETRKGPMHAKISATQLLPWLGTLKAREKAAYQAAKAKYELFEETKSHLFYAVKTAYFDLYFNQQARSILQENLVLIQTLKKLALLKVEAGLVSVIDEYRIEMELLELENQWALLNDKKVVQETNFRKLLNSPQIESIVLPDVLWTTDFALSKQAARDSLLRFNHQLLAIDYRQAALGFQRKLATKEGHPQLKLGLDYTLIGQGENRLAGDDAFVFPRLGISIPLNRNKYKAMVQEVMYREIAQGSQMVEQSNLLETLFEKSWSSYSDAIRRIVLYSKQYELALKTTEILETEYTTANRDFEEIIRMERKLLKFHLQKEQAIVDKQAAIAFIMYLMGK